jgi:hypothetical protein
MEKKNNSKNKNYAAAAAGAVAGAVSAAKVSDDPKDDFFAAKPRERKLTVPKLGKIIVRELALEDRIKVEAAIAAAGKGGPSRMARLVAAGTYYAEGPRAGNRVFSDDPIDAERIDSLPSHLINDLGGAAMDVNDLLAMEKEAAKK